MKFVVNFHEFIKENLETSDTIYEMEKSFKRIYFLGLTGLRSGFRLAPRAQLPFLCQDFWYSHFIQPPDVTRYPTKI